MPCFSCNTRAETLATCASCKKATYCSRECQEKHWSGNNGHKLFCAAESADGELITHRDSLLARVATKNPDLFGPVRAYGTRKVAIPKAPWTSALMAAVQTAGAPEDDAKLAAASDLPKEGPTNMDSLPVEMWEAIFNEVDFETALRLARTSTTFAALFREIRSSVLVLDKIVFEQDPLQDTAANVWRAELLRRAIKFILADVRDDARRKRLDDMLSSMRPTTFYALFLALGRPIGYDYKTHKTYVEELDSFWHIDQTTRVDPVIEELKMLAVMSVHPMGARVPKPQEIFRHLVRVDSMGPLFVNYFKMLQSVPNTFHLGFNVIRDALRGYISRATAKMLTFLPRLIYEYSVTLTAADFANLFYFENYRHIVGTYEPIDPSKFEYGFYMMYRPMRDITTGGGGHGPYIPDEVAESLRGIFSDPTVPASDKLNGWKFIDKPAKFGQGWLFEWDGDVTRLLAKRSKTREEIPVPTVDRIMVPYYR